MAQVPGQFEGRSHFHLARSGFGQQLKYPRGQRNAQPGALNRLSESVIHRLDCSESRLVFPPVFGAKRPKNRAIGVNVRVFREKFARV